MAGVALRDIHFHFAWQVVNHHLLHTSLLTTILLSHTTGTLRGRRGNSWHPLSFCVAGVALRALGWLWWRAWTGLVAGDAAALCVAGVALGDIRIPPPHRLSHTTLSHTIFCYTMFHTPLCHTHHLSHTQLCHTLSFTNTNTHTIFHTQLCHTPSFTHNFVTHKHTHTVFLCHTLSFTYHFVTHNSSHTLFYFSIIHHILCLSFLPRPPYNVCRSVLEEVDLWGYPVL